MLNAKPSTLNLVGVGVLLYGLLQVAEGIGLWSLKRWGEYVAVVGTTLFIPLEIYEITEKVSWLKIVVLIINVAAVLYLLLSKRLFGLRGGHHAYEESLHEVSLLEVEESSAERSASRLTRGRRRPLDAGPPRAGRRRGGCPSRFGV